MSTMTTQTTATQVCKYHYSTFSHFKAVNVVDENIRIQRYIGLFDNILKTITMFIQCR